MADIKEIERGDYVIDKYGSIHKIYDIWGISKYGRLAKPSWGGFWVETDSGDRVMMWNAIAYYKASDPKVKEFLGDSNASI